MYKQEFKNAVERTKGFGLNCPIVRFQEGRLLTPELMGGFAKAFQEHIGEPDVEDVVAQCLSFHFRLLEPMSNIVGMPCQFTIGYVETNERLMFHQTEESLLNILENGIKGSTLNIHAWLTLPTMEIIDLSLPTSYAVINNHKEGIGGVIAQHPDELTGGMKYHPMLIGEDFLIKSGAMIGFRI
ncbi:hypothetical protein [Agarivorans sp. 1_MG-2023]|uniref:hypothetical protein n=1 Tax=Agarivorans sp. 1_MG-2023 TaxID=3062634 RepID=UPI0026E18C56|nr:hypothetical protein [Agarivorans sp. 1_MG-2023]MDO6761910.1 hypothetical protein [Agarivorans sp. 1_MG-2023]